MSELTIFTSADCAPCRMAKKRLSAAGVTFHEVSIQEDLEAADHLRSAGYQQTPVFRWKSSYHTITDLAQIIREASKEKAA